MRMMPRRTITGKKLKIKPGSIGQMAYVTVPAKGLTFESKLFSKDQQTAAILTNFYVYDDRIDVRAGFVKRSTMPDAKPIAHLIPYYGAPESLLAATNFKLQNADTGATLKSGLTSDEWSWTAYANLGDRQYAVMCNGSDGIFSWDGAFTPPQAPVVVTKIEKTNPARITVGAADIGKFRNGLTVVIAGATGQMTAANGGHMIFNLGKVVNTFELDGVNLTGASADQTTGAMSATIQGSFAKEDIRPPLNADGTPVSWILPGNMHIVMSFQNRLWFADETNLALYYLPIYQKTGVLDVLPLNAIFKRGGTIKAMYTWTVDGGMGMDDQIVVWTTNGECAIYGGTDPETDFALVGVYRVEPPMSKWAVSQYGGELYVLLPTGVTPMTAMIRAGKEGMETVDRSVTPVFLEASVTSRENPGWELFLNPSTGRMYANLPRGWNTYDQMIRHMPKNVWSKFENIPARCWAWVEPYVYFGDDYGNVYQMHPNYQSDNGRPIKVDVQMSWNQFNTPAIKHFKMILPYLVTDGSPRPAVDVKVDYDTSTPINIPEAVDQSGIGSSWDEAPWDTSDWLSQSTTYNTWTGVGSLGHVGAVRLTAHIANCSFSVRGFTVLYEKGAII